LAILKRAIEIFLNLLFPSKCLLCHRLYPSLICPDCLSQIKPFSGKTCSLCGVPLQGKSNLCFQCTINPPLFQKAIFYGLYEGKLEEAILRFKFQDHPDLAEPLGKLMIQKWLQSGNNVDLVTSVPLSSKRLRIRGYNQAELLARVVAKGLNVPYRNLLKKKRETLEQSKLKREERLKNLIGVFQASSSQSLSGEKVLLVDDVLTTGATASECAKTLLSMGASSVYVLTLARGTGDQRAIS
jgi:ComF family protein